MAKNIDFNELCNAIAQIDEAFIENTAKAINKNVTARNWLTGYYIVHYEQNGNDRATYGAKTLQKLAERLNKKSLSYRNLKLYRQFYMEFKNLARPVLEFTASEFGSNRLLMTDLGANLEALPPMGSDLASGDCQIGQAVIAQSEKIEISAEILFNKLPFTHLSLIMALENPLARTFYELETIKGVWSSRELKRQIDSNYFERTALSKNPAKMSAIVQSRIAQTGHFPTLKDLVKSPYVYEFIGLNNKDVVEESDNVHVHYKVQILQLRHFIALSNGVLRRPVRSEPIVSFMEFSLAYWFEYLQYALLNQSVPYARYSEWSHFAVILWDLGSSYPSWLIVSQLVSYFSDYKLYGIFLYIPDSFPVNASRKAAVIFADISVCKHNVFF